MNRALGPCPTLVFAVMMSISASGCCKFDAPAKSALPEVYRVDKPSIYKCKTVDGKVDEGSCEKITAK